MCDNDDAWSSGESEISVNDVGDPETSESTGEDSECDSPSDPKIVYNSRFCPSVKAFDGLPHVRSDNLRTGIEPIKYFDLFFTFPCCI